MSDSVLALYMLSHSVLNTSWSYYDLHFTNDETKTQKS